MLKRNLLTRCTITTCNLQSVILSRNRQGVFCALTDVTACSAALILALKTKSLVYKAGPSSSQFSRSCTSCQHQFLLRDCLGIRTPYCALSRPVTIRTMLSHFPIHVCVCTYIQYYIAIMRLYLQCTNRIHILSDNCRLLLPAASTPRVWAVG